MKSAHLSYHRRFPHTPVSRWVNPPTTVWRRNSFADGKMAQADSAWHPFETSLKLWCLLEVEFQGIRLQFATPAELDHFCDVMGRNPLPSGPQLHAGTRLGRPNSHWLSRLPAKAKSAKFRRALLLYLSKAPKVSDFREFYRRTPPLRRAEGLYASRAEAEGQGGETSHTS